MTAHDTNDAKTYLLKTRDAATATVASSVEKYYGDLFSDIVSEPSGHGDVVLCTTTHSLPADAFQRITKVVSVAERDRYVDATDSETIGELLSET